MPKRGNAPIHGEMLQGTLDLLVLKTLAVGTAHGHSIAYAIETDENIARGMTPAAARDAARRKLGNATLVREEIYQMNTVTLVDSAWRDVKYGARLLRLNPAFAIVAILSLALGIGANTAIFQLLDAVRIRTLPVKNPDELMEIRIAEPVGGRTGQFSGRR